jgi:transposase
MEPNYPTNISSAQFEEIRPLLESCRKKTKPRTINLHHVFCGVLYLLKTGCQWRALPSDFPKWRTVHKDFQDWTFKGVDGQRDSVLELALKKMCGKY